MGYTLTYGQTDSTGTHDPKLPNAKYKEGNLNFFAKYRDCGLDFVTVTKVLKQRRPDYVGVKQPATYNVNGMPANAIIIKAFMWASASATDQGKRKNFTIKLEDPKNQKFSSQAQLIGSGPDKCWKQYGWGYNNTYTYRADVTPAISGNGNYKISGFPVDSNYIGNAKLDMDGATLLVIYRDPTDTTTGTIYLKDGATTVIGQRASSQILGGFKVQDTPSNVRAFAMFGDIQFKNTVDFGSATGTMYGTFWNYVEASPNLVIGQNTIQYKLNSAPTDCYVWTAMGIYWKEPGGGYKPDAKASSNSPICIGDTLKFDASGGKIYEWSGPDGFQSGKKSPIIIGAKTSASGRYKVKVSNKPGACSDTAIINVKVNAPNISLSYNDPLCLGDTLILNASGGQTYQWIGPNNFNSNIQQPTINQVGLKDEGIYQVTVTDTNGCVDSASIKLNIDIPDIKAITNEPCMGDTLRIKGTGGSSYLWKGPQGLQSTDSTLVIYPASKAYSGIYYLLGTDSNGCVDSTSININVNPNPIANAWPNVDSIPLSEFIKFIDSSKSNIVSWHWDFGDQTQSSKKSPDHKYNTFGIFKVILKVKNKYGCTDTTIMYVKVYPKSGIFIPNVFSPNGDGVNDKFIITGENFDEFTLKIYNRWGTLLFTSNNASKSWDGIITSTGKHAAAGTYYFILAAKRNDKDYSTGGYLTLLR